MNCNNMMERIYYIDIIDVQVYTAISIMATGLLYITVTCLLDEALVHDGTESTEEKTFLDQNTCYGGRLYMQH